MDVALKEWAVLVEALASGRQSVLLRKGGIVEARRGFEARHPEFLFFPTFEHQHASFIRPEHDDLFERAKRDYQPGALRIELYAHIVEVLAAPFEPSPLRAASGLHIWNDRYIEQRYEYRPDLPLYVLLVRAFRLREAVVLPMRSSYAGCKSWVNLTEDVDVSGAVPVLGDGEFESVRGRVRGALAIEAA